MFEDFKKRMNEEGKKYVELHIAKRDGLEFCLIMDEQAYLKLPKTKLNKLLNVD